ncbi:MAG: patatin-like phospholipase family protein [Bryobacteraceae bacterium]
MIASTDQTRINAAKTKSALVLSAGGMFGSYQAGAWDALSEVFQPDVVVGASIGSINGYLIASGCDPHELIRQWLTLENASSHRWRMPRLLTEGVIDCSPMEARLQKICLEYQPKIEYGVVVTELRTLKPRLFRWPAIGWEHLAASCAVPVLLKNPRIGGLLYCDGGVVDPLPLWAAVEMGASKIVAVNLLKHRPRVIRAAVHAAQMYSRYRTLNSGEFEVVEVSPGRPLGTVADTMYWRRENAQRWIALGQQDGSNVKHLVVECLNRA